MKDSNKHYSNKEITVSWKPHKCIHAGICVQSLPEVYKPSEKPWIHLSNAESHELIAQIKKCPSGALSFTLNGEKNVSNTN